METMGDESEFGDKFRAAMAAQLSSGEYHDFVISCGGHDFKVHRNIIAAHSDFFRASVGPNFHEGVSRTLNMPDDDPALVARMLTYMYTREYYVDSLALTNSGLELAQFRGIADPHIDESGNRCQQTLLHCHIFALADKYNFEELRSKAFACFCKCINGFGESLRHIDRGLQDEPSNISADTANDIARIAQAVYSSTPENIRELRDEIMDWVKIWGEEEQLFSHESMRTVLLEIPGLAHDLAIIDWQETIATCKACKGISCYRLGLCSCGKAGGCSSKAYKTMWRRRKICSNCYRIGTLSYPV